MQLQPISFVMNSDPKGRTELGLIAQDVEPLYPNLVETDATGMRSMNYVGLIAPLIEATKEQEDEINQLQVGLAVLFLGGVFLLWRNRAKPKMPAMRCGFRGGLFCRSESAERLAHARRRCRLNSDRLEGT